MNRDEVKFITLQTYNKLAKTEFKTIEDLIYNTPTFKRELRVRRELISNPYDLSMIVVVEKIPKEKSPQLYIKGIFMKMLKRSF